MTTKTRKTATREGWPPLPVGTRIAVLLVWPGNWSARATTPHGHSELASGADPGAAMEALRLALLARAASGEVFS